MWVKFLIHCKIPWICKWMNKCDKKHWMTQNRSSKQKRIADIYMIIVVVDLLANVYILFWCRLEHLFSVWVTYSCLNFAVICAGPLFCEDQIELNHCKLFLLTMSFNQQNWDCYLEASQTYFGELNSTDPNRFPIGNIQFH